MSASITYLFLAIGALGLCVFAVIGQKTRASDNHPANEAAIRDHVRQLETGWNTKQGALFAKPFADDADYVAINGLCIQGRATIEKGHQQIFDTVYKNTTLKLSVQHIRFLRADIALVHVSGHRDAPPSEIELVGDAFITMVMTRATHGWEIAAFHNTPVVNTNN